MIINMTLVVQAGNFLIAYIMIRTLLLRPAYTCICEDDATYEKVLSKITEQKKRLKIQEERIAERWRAFQQTFLEHEPAIARAQEVIIAIVPGIPELPAPDEGQIKQLANETSDILIEKVSYVR